MSAAGRALAGCWRVRRFKIWVEDFDVALFAQVGEPLVEEEIDLLLEENFLNAGRDSFQSWNGLAGAVLRQERVCR